MVTTASHCDPCDVPSPSNGMADTHNIILLSSLHCVFFGLGLVMMVICQLCQGEVCRMGV